MTLNQGFELTAFVRKYFKAYGVKAKCGTTDFSSCDVTIKHSWFTLTLSEYIETKRVYVAILNLLP